MALSLAERASCFEIVSGYWAGATATITNGYGITMELSDLDILTANINTRLNDIDSDATALAKVQALVAKWDAVATDDIDMQAGSIGDVNGVSYSSAKARDRIRDVMHTYLPVIHMVQAIQRRHGLRESSGSAAFAISR